jgi:hypothetical protein
MVLTGWPSCDALLVTTAATSTTRASAAIRTSRVPLWLGAGYRGVREQFAEVGVGGDEDAALPLGQSCAIKVRGVTANGASPSDGKCGCRVVVCALDRGSMS